MTKVYATENHILVISNKVDADLHRHSFLHIFISLDTPFSLNIDNQEIRNEGIILDSNVEHSFDTNNGLQLLFLIDKTSYFAAQLRKKFLFQKQYCVLSKEMSYKLKKLILSLPSIDAINYEDRLRGFFRILDIEYLPMHIHDERVKKVIDILKICTSSEHSIEHLAKQVYLSKSRLSHIFKQNTGMTLSNYLILHKLQKAMYYAFEKMSLTDAALLAGFDSSSHFATVCKKMLGMSPSKLNKDSVFLKVLS